MHHLKGNKLANNTIFSTVYYQVRFVSKDACFFKKGVFFPQPVQFSAGLISISIPRLITNERALQL